VHNGLIDYLALRNSHATCSANLAGLELLLLDSTTTFFPYESALPNRVLAPGEVVYIFENTSGTQPGDINLGVNIGFAPARGGWTMICQPPCDALAAPGVVDFHAFLATAPPTPPPPFPAPVTFSGPMSGVTDNNNMSYQHTGASAVPPNFTSADWAVLPKTR
jgi:hypothetical protein